MGSQSGSTPSSGGWEAPPEPEGPWRPPSGERHLSDSPTPPGHTTYFSSRGVGSWEVPDRLPAEGHLAQLVLYTHRGIHQTRNPRTLPQPHPPPHPPHGSCDPDTNAGEENALRCQLAGPPGPGPAEDRPGQGGGRVSLGVSVASPLLSQQTVGWSSHSDAAGGLARGRVGSGLACSSLCLGPGRTHPASRGRGAPGGGLLGTVPGATQAPCVSGSWGGRGRRGWEPWGWGCARFQHGSPSSLPLRTAYLLPLLLELTACPSIRMWAGKRGCLWKLVLHTSGLGDLT